MTTVSLRLDDNMKKELDEVCESIGMNITTFFMIYAKKVLRDRKIPFELSVPLDPFYSDSNMAYIHQAERQVERGETVNRTIEELEAMAND